MNEYLGIKFPMETRLGHQILTDEKICVRKKIVRGNQVVLEKCFLL